MRSPAPIPDRRSAVWLLCLACTYVLAGPWALTPSLAQHSLPRDVAVTAVPARHLTAPRAASTVRIGRAARETTRWGHTRWPAPDVLVEPAVRGFRGERDAARNDATDHDVGPRLASNRAPYDATAPPALR